MSDKKSDVYELVQRVRFGMKEVNTLLLSSEVKVPVHLAFGHEVIAAALICAMGKEDALFLPHRNIHYQFAAEPSPRKIIDEILLRESGINTGMCGAMNMYNRDQGIMYSSSILGNNLAVVIGYAHGKKIKKETHVSWVVTGDGAIEEGAWYESTLNAVSLDLNCIYIVENNGWSLATSIEQRRTNFDLSDFAKFLGIKYVRLDSNKPEEYLFTLGEVRNDVINSCRPAIVEVFLETQGGYDVVENSNSRYVNYHAGSIKDSNFT